jgi:hypothetical protein
LLHARRGSWSDGRTLSNAHVAAKSSIKWLARSS